MMRCRSYHIIIRNFVTFKRLLVSVNRTLEARIPFLNEHVKKDQNQMKMKILLLKYLLFDAHTFMIDTHLCFNRAAAAPLYTSNFNIY